MAKIIDFSKYGRVNKDSRNVIPEVPTFLFPKALESLRGERRWCSWEWKLTESGRWTKPPMRAMSNEHAASNNRGTWDDLQAVMYRSQEDKTRGVGLMLKGLDNVAIIDLDNCVNERGEIADWAQVIIDRAGSYTEVSPSRTGVKIFGYVDGGGTASSKILRDGMAIELFLNTARYVCVTGEQISDSAFMRDITGLFRGFVDLDRPKAKSEHEPEYVEILTDDDAAYFREAMKWLDNSDYKTWIDAGLALKRFGDAGKELWDEFSARGYDKFDAFRQDLEWRGFKPHSITIGSLIYRAKQNGFEGVKNVEGKNHLEFVNLRDADQPIEWVVKDYMANGIYVIAGPGGVGKTSIVVSLARRVSQLGTPDEAFSYKLRRKVVYLAEEADQVNRIIRTEVRNGLYGINEASEWFHVARTKKLKAEQIAEQLTWAIDKYTTFLPNGYAVRPLVIIDTASASFHLEDENDNAEVSRLISAIKTVNESHSPRSCIWIIAHMAKGVDRNDVEAASARGASSWGDDANGLVLVVTDPSEGFENSRFTYLKKTRVEVENRWAEHTSEVFESRVVEPWSGEEQVLRSRVSTPNYITQEQREERREQHATAQAEQTLSGDTLALIELLRARGGEIPKSDLPAILRRSRAKVQEALDRAIEDGAVAEESAPPAGGRGGRERVIVRLLLGMRGQTVTGRIETD